VPSRPTFRPAARSRSRIAAGVGLLAVAVVINLAVYRSLDDRHAVVQVVHDVPAGQQIVAGDLRTVEVSADPTIRTVTGESMPFVVGQYAKVRLVAGSLVVAEALQATPLVGSGSSLVAVALPSGELPTGLRERSHVSLVLPAIDTSGTAAVVGNVEAWVVGLPAAVDGGSGDVAVTFEVAAEDAAAVAMAERVRVVVLEPGIDPATAGATIEVTGETAAAS
jgi:hypothetical protein